MNEILKRSTGTLFLLFFLCSFVDVNGQTNPYNGWHKTYNDTLQGVNMEQALSFLHDKKIKAHREVVVGIIDSGIDTTSVDLIPALWKNKKEKADGRDNDKNGYVDDLHGWNFLGTKDGSFNMTSAGTEEYREFKRLYPKYKSADTSTVSDTTEYAYYERMKKKAGIVSYLRFVNITAMKDEAYCKIDSILKEQQGINIDTLTVSGLANLNIDNETWNNACQAVAVDMLKSGEKTLWKDVRKEHDDNFALMKKRIYGIEHDQDKRLLMGDNMQDANDRFYGNPTLQIEGCMHGTFVAGVIAGQGINNKDVKGVCPEAKLMIIRAVADGDEYDKDIATAIRYAVDNGAKVINMSLGKYASPSAEMVNEAIAYALKKDVLIVQAAGNNKRNIDDVAYFPTAKDSNGNRFANYLRVGSVGRTGKRSSFSNYGATEVDVFAPGEDITSTTLNNEYETSQGTSIAAPVVSGVAAMIRMYFPKLSAADVKEIIISSVRPITELKEYCKSGGIVDAFKAVETAVTYTKKRK